MRDPSVVGRSRIMQTAVAAAFAVLLLLLSTRPAHAFSNIVRLDDDSGGPVSWIASTPIGSDRVVIATRAGGGKLEVAQWRLQADDKLKSLGSAGGGKISRVAIASLGDSMVVTAVRTESGNLKLITFFALDDGTVVRAGEIEAGAITDVAIAGHNINRLVTAVRQADGRLKLISWRVDGFGAITRLDDTLEAAVGDVAIVEYEAQRFVTAATSVRGRGSLVLTAWQMDDNGHFTVLDSASTGILFNPSLALISYRRVLVAGTDEAGDLGLSTWDLDVNGLLTQRSSAQAGAATEVHASGLAGAHAITALRQGDGTLKLIHWDAVSDLVRVGDTTAGAAPALALSILRDYRIITPVRDGSGMLKVIAWNEQAMTMLRGTWNITPGLLRAFRLDIELAIATARLSPRPGELPDVGEDVFGRIRHVPIKKDFEVPGPILQSPQWADRWEPNVQSAGWDPMIAVGFNYIVVTSDHQVGFFDKNGDQLAPKAGEKTKMSASEFFGAFLTPTTDDGFVNEMSINRHLAHDPGFPEAGVCDPDLSTVPQPSPSVCINEMYDTRVFFDAATKRFVIVSAARGNTGFKRDAQNKDIASQTDPVVRRYVGIAVSRTEDPRDGFYQYMTTESNYSDWPRVWVDHDLVVVAHNSKQSSLDGSKPAAYLYSIAALHGHDPYPEAQKIYPVEVGGNVMQVTQQGADPGWSFFFRRAGKKAYLYSFRPPVDWSEHISLVSDHIDLSEDIGFPRHGATYRAGRLYLSFEKEIVAPIANGKNGRYSIRVVRIPVQNLNTGPTLTKDKAKGFLDFFFGRNALDDDPSDLVSYEVPALAVNADDDILIGYGRVEYETVNPLYPEVRYSVYYADGRGLARSRLLNVGDHMPYDVKSNQTQSTITNPARRMDYSTAVVDPSDDRAIYYIGAYANGADGQNATNVDGYRTVVGKIVP